MENFVSLVILFALGYWFRHLKAFPKDTAQSLNLFVIYVSLPALILYQVPKVAFSSGVLVPVLLPWAALLGSAAIVLIASRAFKWERGVTGALLLVVPLGNTSFLGIPMVTSFFGPERVPYALLYDQFGSFLALSTYGTYVLAYYGSGTRPNAAQMARKILTFPPFIALAAALMTRSVTYPHVLESAFKLFAASLVPVVMVAVGFQLKLAMDREHYLPMTLGLGIKLLIAPIAAIALCRALGLTGEAVDVALFESAMPPMITAGALAIMGGLAAELVAAMVGYGLILSFATLPLIHKFISYI